MKADFEALVLGAPHVTRAGRARARAGIGRAGMNISAQKSEKPVHSQKRFCLQPYSRISATSVPVIGQMSSLAALEKRVKALEDDEDFSKPSYVPPPPAASSASSSEVDALRKENAKLQDLLAKERYRIKHLIRAIEAKS